MDILYLLVPLSVLLVLAILGVFAWALHNGQFDDVEQQGARILDAADAPLDAHQIDLGVAGKQCALQPSTTTTEKR